MIIGFFLNCSVAKSAGAFGRRGKSLDLSGMLQNLSSLKTHGEEEIS